MNRWHVTYTFDDGASYARYELGGLGMFDYREGGWIIPWPNSREDTLAFAMDEVFSQTAIGRSLCNEHGDVVAIEIRGT